MPLRGDAMAVEAKQRARIYRVAPLCVQGVEDLCSPGGRGLLDVSDRRICVSAVKRHETREGLVVRLFNLTAEHVAGSISTGFDVASAFRVDLLEERIEALPGAHGREIPVALGPHEIVTLEATPA